MRAGCVRVRASAIDSRYTRPGQLRPDQWAGTDSVDPPPIAGEERHGADRNTAVLSSRVGAIRRSLAREAAHIANAAVVVEHDRIETKESWIGVDGTRPPPTQKPIVMCVDLADRGDEHPRRLLVDPGEGRTGSSMTVITITGSVRATSADRCRVSDWRRSCESLALHVAMCPARSAARRTGPVALAVAVLSW